MAKKKNEHTGFRNGDLFCFNCGTFYKISLPQPVDMVTAIIKQFSKSHNDCVKTWIEPVANPNLGLDLISAKENANWWLMNGEHGISSKTIFKYLYGYDGGEIKIQFEDTPCDPDDFRRCYLLLKAVPQWKMKLHLMKPVSPTWSKLVDNWDKLTVMLEEQMQTKKANGMYEFMKTIGC